MSPLIDDGSREHHLIEAKGPHSYWVLRFMADRDGAGRRYSRVVYFARDQREAERYVHDTETHTL